MRLQREAPRQGGQVIALVGNHEAMNMIGDLRYVDPGEYAAFADANSAAMRERAFESLSAEVTKTISRRQSGDHRRRHSPQMDRTTPLGWVEHRLAWRPSGELGRWVVRNPAVALVQGNLVRPWRPQRRICEGPDRPRSTGEFARPSQNNEQSPDLDHQRSDRAAYGTAALSARTGRSPRRRRRGELATVLPAYGAKRIIVAHTPLLAGIKILDGGKLVRIDSGNSRYYGGQLSYLEIMGDRLIPHSVPRSGR